MASTKATPIGRPRIADHSACPSPPVHEMENELSMRLLRPFPAVPGEERTDSRLGDPPTGIMIADVLKLAINHVRPTIIGPEQRFAI